MQMLDPHIKPTHDFTWLKDLLDKGGIMMTAVKCPQCGASLNLPKEGNLANCRFCGQTVYVEDVLKIIKELNRS